MVASFVYDIDSWTLNTDFFNQASTGGYIKYVIGDFGIQNTAGAIIHPDGRVIIAGSGHEEPS